MNDLRLIIPCVQCGSVMVAEQSSFGLENTISEEIVFDGFCIHCKNHNLSVEVLIKVTITDMLIH